MTIYTLMNKVHSLGFYATLALKCYRKHDSLYATFEDMARASLNTLYDVNYITSDEYDELFDQLMHVFRMYKRH